MKVEILGVGCAKCHKLYDAVTELVKKNGIDAEVVKVEDIKVGTRVVVTAVQEKDKSMTAKAIDVGVAPAETK